MVYLPTNCDVNVNVHVCVSISIFKFLGYNPDEGKLCAGPRIANSEDGKVQVGPCDKETLIHLPPSMVDIAQVNSMIHGKFKNSLLLLKI